MCILHITQKTWKGTFMAWFSIRPTHYTVHTVHCILHIAYWTAHLLTCMWEIFVLITEVVIIGHHRLRHCIIICLGRHVHVLEISWLHSGGHNRLNDLMVDQIHSVRIAKYQRHCYMVTKCQVPSTRVIVASSSVIVKQYNTRISSAKCQVQQ